jgi:hypothetical protein
MCRVRTENGAVQGMNIQTQEILNLDSDLDLVLGWDVHHG